MKKRFILTLFLCFSFLTLSLICVTTHAEDNVNGENTETQEVIESEEDESSNKNFLTNEEKDEIKANISFYVRLIIEFLSAIGGSGVFYLIAWRNHKKTLKDLQDGTITQEEATVQLKEQKEALEKEKESIKETNEKFVGELKKQYNEALETIKQQNISINTLMEKVSKANLVIAEVITQTPALVSSGLTEKLLEIFDEGGVNDESKN